MRIGMTANIEVDCTSFFALRCMLKFRARRPSQGHGLMHRLPSSQDSVLLMSYGGSWDTSMWSKGLGENKCAWKGLKYGKRVVSQGLCESACGILDDNVFFLNDELQGFMPSSRCIDNFLFTHWDGDAETESGRRSGADTLCSSDRIEIGESSSTLR